MLRKFIVSVVCATVLTLGGASAALAVDGTDAPYPAPSPTEATLAGSVVSPVCVQDVPWIDYSVTLVDPSNVSKGHVAYLDITDGTNTETLTLGAIDSNGTISGRVLWPGASVDANGVGTGWPGWKLQDGEWLQTNGNYAWTRGTIHGVLRVNPSVDVAMSYPPATPQCTAGPGLVGSENVVQGQPASVASGALPATGGDTVPVLIASAGAIVLLGVGGALLVRSRRARSTTR